MPARREEIEHAKEEQIEFKLLTNPKRILTDENSVVKGIECVKMALGEPDSTFESNSCAYQGKDKFYYYDGFEILVNDVDGTERITGITIADDTVSTPQGVKIGMKIDEALSLMDGIEYAQSGDTYKFTVGSTLFRLQAGDDGTVAAAEYSVATNDK